MSRSIGLRGGLLNFALKAIRDLYDMKRTQEFWDLVVAEVAKVDPDTARRIMIGLSELNQRSGITFDARP